MWVWLGWKSDALGKECAKRKGKSGILLTFELTSYPTLHPLLNLLIVSHLRRCKSYRANFKKTYLVLLVLLTFALAAYPTLHPLLNLLIVSHLRRCKSYRANFKNYLIKASYAPSTSPWGVPDLFVKKKKMDHFEFVSIIMSLTNLPSRTAIHFHALTISSINSKAQRTFPKSTFVLATINFESLKKTFQKPRFVLDTRIGSHRNLRMKFVHSFDWLVTIADSSPTFRKSSYRSLR
ncbi:hypothetical protein HanIR_Chr17g0863841 [Helianthus annuus]|nr:hypothetical protein HanIR_Chr17g0863841 [Helianthus annuus]